jgi:hypothetical protein
VIVSAAHTWSNGPFSAVRPGEQIAPVQEPAESSRGPEPVDEVVPSRGLESTRGAGAPAMSTQSMAEQGRRTAGAALGGFPQVVHVLANPELHLGQQVSDQTGLPVVNLQQTPVDQLEELLAQPRFHEGFILEGYPADRAEAKQLDSILSATDPNGRRVLGWESERPEQQEIVDHYIDQGLLWMMPSPSAQTPEQVKSTLVECLAGLPARR